MRCREESPNRFGPRQFHIKTEKQIDAEGEGCKDTGAHRHLLFTWLLLNPLGSEATLPT
jgi:hypothetical protein